MAGLDRGVDVVASCKTLAQLRVAHRYLHLAGIRTGLTLNSTLWKAMTECVMRQTERIDRG